jgi:hypothetical protein
VAVIAGINPGWTLLDNFDRYPEGSLAGNGNWANLHYQQAETALIVVTNGNHFLTTSAGDVMGVLPLGDNAIVEGQERTLFFRAFIRGYPQQPVLNLVALTEANFLNGGENNIGLGAALSSVDSLLNPDQTGPRICIGASDGFNAGATYPIVPAEPGLLPNEVYNVWVDVTNNVPPSDNANTGDTFTIWVARDGDTTRELVVQDYHADRDPTAVVKSSLDKLVVNARGGSGTEQMVLFDDFYLSKSGLNTTVPRAYGFTVPVAPTPTLAIRMVGSEIEITWSNGILESSSSVGASGNWAPVTNASSPYRPQPAVVGLQQFYRVRQ